MKKAHYWIMLYSAPSFGLNHAADVAILHDEVTGEANTQSRTYRSPTTSSRHRFMKTQLLYPKSIHPQIITLSPAYQTSFPPHFPSPTATPPADLTLPQPPREADHISTASSNNMRRSRGPSVPPTSVCLTHTHTQRHATFTGEKKHKFLKGTACWAGKRDR